MNNITTRDKRAAMDCSFNIGLPPEVCDWIRDKLERGMDVEALLERIAGVARAQDRELQAACTTMRLRGLCANCERPMVCGYRPDEDD